MFDIGFPEFFIAAVVALVVLGPQRLPAALRTLGLWIGRLRRSYYNVKTEVEREIGMDEVRRQLHNEQIMADVKRVEREVKAMGKDIAGESPGGESPGGESSSGRESSQGVESAPGVESTALPDADRAAIGAAEGAARPT